MELGGATGQNGRMLPQPVKSPQPVESIGRRFALLLAVALGSLYILNPGAGIFELLPDNAPLVGNLDEAGATALVIWAGRKLFFRPRPPQ
jgi:hypothetical protein